MFRNGMTLPRALRGGALVAALVAGTLALGVNDASAQWRRGGGWGPGVAAGVLGGVAAGAIIAGAGNPYYGPGYYGPAPVYGPGPACWFEPQDVWNGYRWVRRRVRVCE